MIMKSHTYLFTTNRLAYRQTISALATLADLFDLSPAHIISRHDDHCQAAVGTATNNQSFQQIRDYGATLQVDVNEMTDINVPKALLMADMDATIIRGESLDELAKLAGIGPEIAGITARAMAGEIDFEEALSARLSLLAGQDADLLDKVIGNTVITGGAASLLATMRGHGHHAYLVSGGFTFLTAHVSNKLNFTGHRANQMDIKKGRLSGDIVPPLLDKSAKARILSELCDTYGISGDNVIAVGDGANDIEMLTQAGLGVAFEGKPALIEHVSVQLSYSDLSALLYLQAYDRDSFVTP